MREKFIQAAVDIQAVLEKHDVELHIDYTPQSLEVLLIDTASKEETPLTDAFKGANERGLFDVQATENTDRPSTSSDEASS